MYGLSPGNEGSTSLNEAIPYLVVCFLAPEEPPLRLSGNPLSCWHFSHLH